MAKDSKDWMGAAKTVGAAAATGIPAAIAMDLVAYQYPTMTGVNKDLLVVGGGFGLSALALAFGAPVDFAMGPAVANLGVAGVNTSRRQGWPEKLRVKIAEMRAPASSNGIGRRY